MNDDLRLELLAMARADQDKRAELVRDSRLFDGYCAEIEQIHVRNAQRLDTIVDGIGWPGFSLVGKDGAEAAFLIAQHGISLPTFQRRCYKLLREAVRAGEASPHHEAYLIDRIRFNERRPQMYGTIFEWDENGEMNPWTFENPESVDDRRAAVGLAPLATTIARQQAEARLEGNRPPADFRARQETIEAWARKVGWM